MPFASILIDDQPKSRMDAFMAGAEKIGLLPSTKERQSPNRDEVLIIWNRHRHAAIATVYERAGAPVIVAENGYIGKDSAGHPYYALARDHHNGAGRWPVGDDNRWATFGINVRPWRRKGRHILVLPQRGIGPDGVAMPRNWPQRIMGRLSAVTDREIRIRQHPGIERPSLKPDLEGCWAVVTWGSGAAIKALVAGVPVFHEMPNWIGAAAARYGIDNLEETFTGDREPMLHRLSYAQWTLQEIATGEPFRRLIAI